MKRQDLIELLSPIVPTVYGWEEQAQHPDYPVAVLHYLYNDPVYADNTHYYQRDRWQLDLLTRRRDETLESSIEQALLTRGFLFSHEEETDGGDGYVRAIYRFTTKG